MVYISNLIDIWFSFLLTDLLPGNVVYLITMVVKIVLVIVGIALSVAYLTWLERKIIAAIHLRKGPNVVGIFGLLQPLADGLKLILKEIIIPNKANKVTFFLAPIITFMVALMGFVVIPIDHNVVFANINVGLLYTLGVSSLGVYGIVIAGWSSNSKYAFLGAIRSSAQMISYELSMGLIIVCVVLLTRSLNLSTIVLEQTGMWHIVKLFPLAIMFFIVMLAETNRHPFDLPEAESDLVGGYHTEYSGFTFALFFLAEYANMILISSLFTILFLGGWLPILNFWVFKEVPGFIWFAIKVIFLLSIMIQLRATLPRYRYDQLMRLGWKVFLPLSLFMVIVIAFIVKFA